jgi:hypothetical protein
MNKETAQIAGQFLQRITLQPSEIEAYTTVMKALQTIMDQLGPTVEVADE